MFFFFRKGYIFIIGIIGINFIFNDGICDELDKVVRRFIWGGVYFEKMICWVLWEWLCKFKL